MSATARVGAHAAAPARLSRAAWLLGFGLGGFFDGILLHQILQWHHLLSAIDGGILGDLRGQVLADGIFHALMYAIAATGLWLLARARAAVADERAPRRLAAGVLVGFGAWHVLDAVLSHWLTGIHRIRMDSTNPLAWDIGWLVVFGLIPLAIGIAMRRRDPGNGIRGGGRSGTTAALLVAGATLAAAAVSAWPPSGDDRATVTVVLRPDVHAQRLFAALAGTDARIVWGDATGSVWVLRLDARASRFGLYRHGAILVSGTMLPAGCAVWLRDDPGRRL